MTTPSSFYGLLADLVLVVHFAFVLFVLLGLLAIWTGRFLRWSWVRNFWFRLAHLLAIGIVVAESVGGVVCPLTTWEDKLRRLAGGGKHYAGSFIQHWVHRAMFFEAAESTFTIIYVVFFAAVLSSFWVVKPRWPVRRGAASGRFTLCLVPFAAALSGEAADVPVTQRTAPPAGIQIAAQDRERLEAGAARLAKEIESLRPRAGSDARVRELLPDVEIFHKAVDWALRYDEFFRSNEVTQADHLLRLGAARARQLADGKPAWLATTGLVVRGYRSKIDGSVQPYGLVVPATFAGETKRPRRLDVWLHGRDDKLTELKFISDRLRSHGEFTPPDTLVLHPFGRYCNAFKFAGETDVFEALAHVQRFYPVDTNRLAIRGFSMGGAGTWHLAAHHPDVWAAAAPGAGFAETAEYTGALTKDPKPAWYEQKLWHLYDATDYALNLFNVPTIAYSGELDKQKQAADRMARAMKAEGLELQHIIGPGVGHKYEPGAKKELARRFDQLMNKARESLPKKIVLTTSTLRYNKAGWLALQGLEQHWTPARIAAEIDKGNSIRIATTNVSSFVLDLTRTPLPRKVATRIRIDGESFKLPAVPAHALACDVWFEKGVHGWTTNGDRGCPVPYKPRKWPGLQGPIDDAFMDTFVVVRPTGKPLNEASGIWVQNELARMTNEWRGQFRGDVWMIDDSTKNARELNDAFYSSNLILWGDPQSNRILARLLPHLPLRWEGGEFWFGTNHFNSTRHMPVLVFPNPMGPRHYIVLNIGPTFLDSGAASNAQQTPKLPDYAVLDITVPRTERLTRGVALAGFFDEIWKLSDASGAPSR